MIHLLVTDLTILISLFLWKAGPVLPETRAQQEPACTECHSDLVEHDLMHGPAADACDNCHAATGEEHPGEAKGFTLVDGVPALCYYCHEEDPEQDHPHRPVNTGACMDCHDAHGSAEAYLLRSGEQELCLSCHNRAYVSDSSETGNIRRQVTGRMLAHSAVEAGGCTACHLAHGTGMRKLLVDRYPEGDYVLASAEAFGLCFLCHDPELIDTEETEWGTGFRNGTLNLHRLHIQGDKGRNCRLCHDIHGSEQPFLIRTMVPFGNWEMEMKFVPGDQGGSCMPGCHGKLSYRRE